MTDRDARAYRLPIGALSTEGVFRLDAEGRVVRSPAIEKLVTAARRVTDAWRKVGAKGDSAGLMLALAEVDAEAHALERVPASQPFYPARICKCGLRLSHEAHTPPFDGRGSRHAFVPQARQNKELPPNVDHGLETPKPGGEPGSDVVSECQAPDPSVTSGVEK